MDNGGIAQSIQQAQETKESQNMSNLLILIHVWRLQLYTFEKSLISNADGLTNDCRRFSSR